MPGWIAVVALVAAAPVEPCPELPVEAGPASSRSFERAACFEAAMNREVDLVVVPLRSKAPARFRAWMDAQARYNRLAKTACGLSETLATTQLATGESAAGSGTDSLQPECLATFWRARLAFVQRFRAGTASAPVPTERATQARQLSDAFEALMKRLDDSKADPASFDARALAADLRRLRRDGADFTKKQCAASAPTDPDGCGRALGAEVSILVDGVAAAAP